MLSRKWWEHRYDVRLSENCIDQNSYMGERQDPDNLPCFPTQAWCTWELTAYVFNLRL